MFTKNDIRDIREYLINELNCVNTDNIHFDNIFNKDVLYVTIQHGKNVDVNMNINKIKDKLKDDFNVNLVGRVDDKLLIKIKDIRKEIQRNINLNVGDRVVVNGNNYGIFFNNEIGTIVYYGKEYSCVCFDRKIITISKNVILGHDCNKGCKDEYGYYIYNKNIKKLIDNKNTSVIITDDNLKQKIKNDKDIIMSLVKYTKDKKIMWNVLYFGEHVETYEYVKSLTKHKKIKFFLSYSTITPQSSYLLIRYVKYNEDIKTLKRIHFNDMLKYLYEKIYQNT